MEAAAVLRSSYGISRSSNFVVKSGVIPASVPDFVYFSGKIRSSNRWIKCPSISLPKQGQRKVILGSRKSILVRASFSSPDFIEPEDPIAPLELESPVGQFLSQILRSHPHLVPAAVDEQLKQLQTDRDAEKQPKEEPSTSGTELILYRRIAEVKANERKKALEEILYALVVQKFMDADVSLIPTIPPSSSDPSAHAGTWPCEEEKLKQLHSPEAYEMIKNHLTLILGNRIGDLNSIVQISKLRVGQVYAASMMYGYFLKRVDQRFQLEKNMKILPHALGKEVNDIEQAVSDVRPIGGETLPHKGQSHPEVSSWEGEMSHGGFGSGIKPSRLRNYVMSFDAETLQKYASIRSKEAVSIIEKQTEALFGRPEIVITHDQTVDSSKDELIGISFGGLKRLVLEAVTFGSFLWDVESYVDSRYHFVMN